MYEEQACNLVIFGGNGDLALRKLLPALFYLERNRQLGRAAKIIAAARSPMTTQAYLEQAGESLRRYLPEADYDAEVWEALAKKISYLEIDATIPAQFSALGRACEDGPSPGSTVYYLATPPTLFSVICKNLAEAGLVDEHSRVVLEKPLGHDLDSSQQINRAVTQYFPERQIFRIDHYLGKETVQNLLALRFANRLFEPVWDSGSIDHVQITVSETIGVEGRSGYYDNFGAMRDMVQNHLLQLLCLVAMEVPGSMDADAVRDEKLKVLRSLRRFDPDTVARDTVRGQYASGFSSKGEPLPGYLDGHDNIRESATETFVALRTFVDNWRWSGVPFYLRTGKNLPVKFSEVIIQFRNVPHSIFGSELTDNQAANRLVLRLQPEETIMLMLMNKVPGLAEGIQLKPVSLNLNFKEAFNIPRTPGAYARLLLDVLRNDPTLFVRGDEVEEAWRWVDTIIDAWQASGEKPLAYPAGTWGPDAVDKLIGRDGRTWGPAEERFL